jgi:hypothetical protein
LAEAAASEVVASAAVHRAAVAAVADAAADNLLQCHPDNIRTLLRNIYSKL